MICSAYDYIREMQKFKYCLSYIRGEANRLPD